MRPRRRSVVGAAGCVVGVFVALCASLVATPFQSVRDGIYTEAQADRGWELYHDTCEGCHAPDLSGGKVIPGLSGQTFAAAWNGLSVGQLFERVRASMPEDDPSRLTSREKADIVAFILRANGLPAGSTELPDRTDLLNTHVLEIPGGVRDTP